jgi:aryl-alcohol dehydrogenase-like predicted oxidoreductase
LILRWLLEQSNNIIPIPGTKRTKYFDENMAALNLELSDEENREIRAAVEKADVRGGRYPPGWHRTLFADTVPLQ